MVTFREVLLDLMDLPGANYSCVADRVSGTLLAEVGASSVPPGVVMEWGGTAAGFLATTGGDGLDDLMITSHRSYHLVRPVDIGSGRLLMTYLCLDRGRSNLAVARRELAAATLHQRLAVASLGLPAHDPLRSSVAGRESTPAALPTPLPRSEPRSPAVTLLAAPPPPGHNGVAAAPVMAAPGRVQEPLSGSVAITPADRGAGGPGSARPAPPSVPLPRRSGPSRVPPPLPAAPAPAPHPITGQSWATDVSTMRRLLGALRSLR